MISFDRIMFYLDCRYVHSCGTSGGACSVMNKTLRAPHPQLVKDPLEKTFKKLERFLLINPPRLNPPWCQMWNEVLQIDVWNLFLPYVGDSATLTTIRNLISTSSTWDTIMSNRVRRCDQSSSLIGKFRFGTRKEIGEQNSYRASKFDGCEFRGKWRRSWRNWNFWILEILNSVASYERLTPDSFPWSIYFSYLIDFRLLINWLSQRISYKIQH
jgi:hypothetical protein